MSDERKAPASDAVKDEIGEEHGEAAETTSTDDEIKEEFEDDPARSPDNEALKNLKGG